MSDFKQSANNKTPLDLQNEESNTYYYVWFTEDPLKIVYKIDSNIMIDEEE